MTNFDYRISTRIFFGRGQIQNLGPHLKALADHVLLVYGGGSIKRNGLYDSVVRQLNEAGIAFCELPGVEPNPRIGTVRKGVQLCRENQIGAVLAVGGGSTIDCAKAIAGGARYDGDAWDLVLDSSKITDALPVVSVLTLAATGSEMDGFAVISDPDKNEKWGTGSDLLRPAFSILDPEYTYSVSAYQTAAGIADIMSHTFENYFTRQTGAYLQARFCEGILKTCIHYGPIALKKPDDYEARANLMWASSMAINGLCSYGEETAWSVHPMEHELSAFYDITHGVGLAILTPYWMEYVLSDATAPRFADYGRNVWGLQGSDDMALAREAIAKTREFLVSLGLPTTLSAVKIDATHFDVMAQKAADGGLAYAFVPLQKEDVKKIFQMAL